MHTSSSMVVIQPSTGDILAVANNDGFNDFALTAAVAPGSSMKIITSTALFNAGVLTPQSPVACPKAYTVQGITYHNDQGESEPAGTPFMTTSRSPATTRSPPSGRTSTGELASTAKTTTAWTRTGTSASRHLSASYFNAPATASGSELAQEAFGEGGSTASPIAMASVAATVDYGSFKQPILVEGTKQVTATALPATTDTYLKRDDARRCHLRHGGRDRLRARTSTPRRAPPTSRARSSPTAGLSPSTRITDVAVATLVLNAGYGAQFAGPEVKAFLDAS